MWICGCIPENLEQRWWYRYLPNYCTMTSFKPYQIEYSLLSFLYRIQWVPFKLYHTSMHALFGFITGRINTSIHKTWVKNISFISSESLFFFTSCPSWGLCEYCLIRIQLTSVFGSWCYICPFQCKRLVAYVLILIFEMNLCVEHGSIGKKVDGPREWWWLSN